MWKYSILVAAVVVLSACGQQENGDSGSDDTPPTMPEMTFAVTETNDDAEVVMEATVTIASDGSWQRTGTESDSGALTEDQVRLIDELVDGSEFPTDPDDGLACLTVVPDYNWSLSTEDDSVSNSNGGCVSSEAAAEIVGIIKEAADVGPTLEPEE